MDTKQVTKVALAAAGGLLTVLVAIQLVPYGHDHVKRPTLTEAAWPDPATRELAVRACYDCHSNETKWPWYSNVAPISWVVSHHVDEGREMLNFSEMNRSYEEADEAAEVVEEGEMPPAYYTLLHPSARLSPAEKEQLTKALTTMFGSEQGEGAAAGEAGERGERGESEEEERAERARGQE